MEQQHRTLRQGKAVQQFHKFGLLFLSDEQIAWIIFEVRRCFGEFSEQRFFAISLAPLLDTFLMRDAEKPTAEPVVMAQTADVPNGVDKRLLHNVEARLLVMDQLENIDIQGQLIAPKENVPRLRLAGPGLLHWQMFALSHYQHLHRVE